MSLVIKDAKILGKEGRWDVIVDQENGLIGSISEDVGKGDKVLDASNKYLTPGFVNTHTHAAMSLFRGYADDLPLQTWLQEKIWPLEEELTAEDVYWGTKLACLEMIKTGTVAFNDMYYFMERAADAVDEMGMKATMPYGFIDLGDSEKREDEKEKTKDLIDHLGKFDNIKPAVGPHSVYTVSREGLEWCAEYSKKNGLPVHTHIAETEKEMKDFKEEHDVSLTGYLDDIGLLNHRLIGAHAVWLEDEDFENLEGSGAVISHNPSSNMKLGVGKPMDYPRFEREKVTLGTDGCASNNNLDMLEEIKIASLQQKMKGDPTVLPAEEAYKMITEYGAEALGTNGGVVKEGKAADLVLIDANCPQTSPGYNPMSDLIYSLNGSAVTDVIIDGKIVMEERHVEGEDEIVSKATQKGKELVSRLS